MMWALMSFNYELESSDIFLSEAAAQRAIQFGLLYARLHVCLAHDAIQDRIPRYKLRPRAHSFVCETLCGMLNGSRMNAKYVSCWSDKDFIGQACGISRAKAIHPTTLGRRLLERLRMTLNAHLATPR